MVLIESHSGERERPPSSLSSCKTKSFVFDALFLLLLVTLLIWMVPKIKKMKKTPENIIIIINRHVKRVRDNTEHH